MSRLRLLLLSGFIVLLGLGGFIGSGDAQPGTLKEIVPGIWFREGEIKEQGHCNNIIIEMKDYLIVVDANFPSGARLALADAKKVSSKPVKYVFDTHHHGDHAYGNPVWTQAGATTLAYVGVAQEMKRYEPQGWQNAAKGRKDIAELNLATAEPPRQTFDKSPFVLSDGNRRVEFHFFGWAHTRGDGFVYLPNERVLCTGDAVVNGPYNFLGHGNIANWPKVIEAAQKLDIAHVLPGHGGPARKDLLAGQRRYLVELRKAVKAALDQKKKLEEIVTMEGNRPVASSIELPSDVALWKGAPFPAQVRDTYEEILQGKPHGEIAGGK